MGEIIGPLIFLAFIIFSVLSSIQKQRKEAEARKQEAASERRVRMEDLPEATRRALYGDVPMQEGGWQEIPTAQRRPGAPLAAPMPPRAAAPQVEHDEELRRRQAERAAELARQREMLERQKAEALAARQREIDARRAQMQMQPGTAQQARELAKAKQEEMRRQAAETMRRAMKELMGVDLEMPPQPPVAQPTMARPKPKPAPQRPAGSLEPVEGPRAGHDEGPLAGHDEGPLAEAERRRKQQRASQKQQQARVAPAPRVARPDSPRAWLRDKRALRQAIVLREVLGTPRGLE